MRCAMSWAGRAREREVLSEPLVDYVLKFEAIPPEYHGDAKRMPRDVVEARTAELEALVRTIRAQRLRVTSRVAPNDASHLWVFVNAPDDVLVDVRERERYVRRARSDAACTTFCRAWGK